MKRNIVSFKLCMTDDRKNIASTKAVFIDRYEDFDSFISGMNLTPEKCTIDNESMEVYYNERQCEFKKSCFPFIRCIDQSVDTNFIWVYDIEFNNLNPLNKKTNGSCKKHLIIYETDEYIYTIPSAQIFSENKDQYLNLNKYSKSDFNRFSMIEIKCANLDRVFFEMHSKYISTKELKRWKTKKNAEKIEFLIKDGLSKIKLE